MQLGLGVAQLVSVSSATPRHEAPPQLGDGLEQVLDLDRVPELQGDETWQVDHSPQEDQPPFTKKTAKLKIKLYRVK